MKAMKVLAVLTLLLCVPALAQAAKGGNVLDQMNAKLEAMGADVRVAKAEMLGTADADPASLTIFARNVGNKQLDDHFVPCDPRRGGFCDIAWAVDTTEGATTSGLLNVDTEGAINRAMATWDNVGCSFIPLWKVPASGVPLGMIQWMYLGGPSPAFIPDYAHAGWLPGAYFAPGVIGVTYTFVFVDGGGNFTDIDNNRKVDVAFRETYYNDAYTWSLDGPAWFEFPEIDVETVALHEAGHGLSQAHFGKMFVDGSEREPPYWVKHVHFAPRALMNAVYWDTLRTLLGSDVAGHCSIWAPWPIH